jgi:hypothetical protein
MIKPCLVCGTNQSDRPMCFMGEAWCSDRCRKVVMMEDPPVLEEMQSMDRNVLKGLISFWKIGEEDSPVKLHPEELKFVTRLFR